MRSAVLGGNGENRPCQSKRHPFNEDPLLGFVPICGIRSNGLNGREEARLLRYLRNPVVVGLKDSDNGTDRGVTYYAINFLTGTHDPSNGNGKPHLTFSRIDGKVGFRIRDSSWNRKSENGDAGAITTLWGEEVRVAWSGMYEELMGEGSSFPLEAYMSKGNRPMEMLIEKSLNGGTMPD